MTDEQIVTVLSEALSEVQDGVREDMLWIAQLDRVLERRQALGRGSRQVMLRSYSDAALALGSRRQSVGELRAALAVARARKFGRPDPSELTLRRLRRTA